MPTIPSGPKWGFQTKVLVPVISVLILLLVITMALVNRSITTQLRTEAGQKLLTAEAVFKNSQDIRANHLLARYRTIPNEPRFKAVLQLADPKTLRGLLTDLLRELGTEVVLFTAQSNDPGTGVHTDPKLSLDRFRAQANLSLQRALDGFPNVDTIALENRLFEITSVPVSVGNAIVGTLSFGSEISDRVAQEFKQLTRSEILFFVENQVIVSTFLSRTPPTEILQLTGKPAEPIVEIQIEGEHFLGLAGRCTSLSDSTAINYLLLLSYEPSLHALRSAQNKLVWISLLGILFSSAIVWALVRKITHPLRELRDSAEAVGQGDFSRRVNASSRDECGELARVFNNMTANLESSRQKLEQTVETLKTTQAQLVQSEKLSAIGEFVAGVTHELNNPLTTVIGFSELLQEVGVDDKQKKYLERITDGAQRCHKIVSGLLSFARRHKREKSLVAPHDLIEAAIGILAYQMRTSNISVITEFDPQLPQIAGDPHELQQVFLNLINNARQAIEAAAPRGTIRITTQLVDGTARIRFQDDGPGISQENLGKIFDPFFTTKEVGKGTGLGLSLSYGIIKEHDGTIRIENNPDGGACFTIDLPAANSDLQAHESTSVNPPAGHSNGQGKKVLVVDDEDSILSLIGETLTSDGYQIDIVQDGESALRILRQNQYDLIVCDWKMPGLNGQQVYEQLHLADPEAASRLLFMTGDVINESTYQFFKDSGTLCLSKPFSLSDLRQAAGQVLKSKVEPALN